MNSWDDLTTGQTMRIRHPLAVADDQNTGVIYTARMQRATVIEHNADRILLQVQGGRLDGELLHLECADFPPNELLTSDELKALLRQGRAYLEQAERTRHDRRLMGGLTLVAAACSVLSIGLLAPRRKKTARGRWVSY